MAGIECVRGRFGGGKDRGADGRQAGEDEKKGEAVRRVKAGDGAKESKVIGSAGWCSHFAQAKKEGEMREGGI